MPWKYILNIRLNNEIVYKRDMDENKISYLKKDEGSMYKNDINYEILPVEVLKNARKY
jgi:hypothetical protein